MKTEVGENNVRTLLDEERVDKYLIFRLNEEHFGIGVLQIREIIRLQPITRVPHMPNYVRGVINLRGKVVPVIDLRMKFDFKEVAETMETCIVVIQIEDESDLPTLMGMIVDEVDEVVNIPHAEVNENIDLGQSVDSEYIMGIAKVRGELRVLLKIDFQRIKNSLASKS
ncbi:MAG: chemotaxis protein CheW [Verrucomicrobia bacterium CG_4_10_14_3_um_filter_43_23]|nr:MAG: hypothetical protein AUJ82_06190 [Verrucomicrobia bacterium CG1_02_43_26]PIP60085.1 MAG: chemotaxis protein CheW [Verrucomicrobia bacterium CG22_combo_CG10-13_8_21_14_all_43_17]PIX58668.1 MAG: chemotaxis protein CheW [Verrucomicrobia bacterium CG_4_10_14_3_um_filter_43_23]PIY62617.1 MAG: chemotaxis protein CheW [Verrucomicrobia bacterium CG_4_10_14_0_8_um_filter_43_34]PJA43310.1 MAG: chemotaxis protein CheW [Verrucomicrobia bacterium CG_4_9_14_3_um_filter_43_20]